MRLPLNRPAYCLASRVLPLASRLCWFQTKREHRASRAQRGGVGRKSLPCCWRDWAGWNERLVGAVVTGAGNSSSFLRSAEALGRPGEGRPWRRERRPGRPPAAPLVQELLPGLRVSAWQLFQSSAMFTQMCSCSKRLKNTEKRKMVTFVYSIRFWISEGFHPFICSNCHKSFIKDIWRKNMIRAFMSVLLLCWANE